MEDFFKILLIVIIVAIVLLIAFAVVTNIAKKNAIKKMYNEVEKILEDVIVENQQVKCELEKTFSPQYDYVLKTPNLDYYIKVVPNLSNQEICVNNSVKWQLRKSFNDETMRFVEGIEGLMRMELDNSKAYKKLYIVYPNARTLLKYINECEMVFIHPNTDVYGTNIIPYVAIKENLNLIEIKEEI